MGSAVGRHETSLASRGEFQNKYPRNGNLICYIDPHFIFCDSLSMNMVEEHIYLKQQAAREHIRKSQDGPNDQSIFSYLEITCRKNAWSKFCLSRSQNPPFHCMVGTQLGYWFGAGKYLRGWRINVSVSVTWKKIEVFHGTFLQRTMWASFGVLRTYKKINRNFSNWDKIQLKLRRLYFKKPKIHKHLFEWFI